MTQMSAGCRLMDEARRHRSLVIAHQSGRTMAGAEQYTACRGRRPGVSSIVGVRLGEWKPLAPPGAPSPLPDVQGRTLTGERSERAVSGTPVVGHS